ncbi:ribonuclease T2 family protein [Wenxinia marina]|uniref:Ribonuclease I n=1 Tax=Wenxinia marina DSM 24838 TaxID=1123501 RepID=A0A0D0Q4C0_9RHOB|nr:ribonuclease T2 [Wenxinia marina]KIQ67412.1 Ribonuclease I [Wenxinia marina DSM 24838]GGL69677.1 ribonuclease T(2) [Wenxinia marina]
MKYAAIAALLALAAPARADGTAGDFDYYVLSLSWSPTWCRQQGQAEGSEQCADGAGFGWVLHGLWPQYEEGWPDYCATSFAPPSRGMTGAMADIMGTGGSAWHQWRKHGVCSGLSPADYYALAREAYGRVTRPEVFERLEREVTLPAEVVEEAFTTDNPGLDPPEVTVTCRSGMIQEVRVCMTRDLEFRRCGADVIRDCTLDDALLLPVR